VTKLSTVNETPLFEIVTVDGRVIQTRPDGVPLVILKLALLTDPPKSVTLPVTDFVSELELIVAVPLPPILEAVSPKAMLPPFLKESLASTDGPTRQKSKVSVARMTFLQIFKFFDSSQLEFA